MVDQAATANRARIALTISKDSMTASILIRAPKTEESPITVEEIMGEVEKAGVTFGIDHQAIEKAVNERQFNTPIKIAQGKKPDRGVNTSFVYHFDTSTDHKPKEDHDGHIDYRDISFIQNCETGTLLVTKTPPSEGAVGFSVLGKEIKGPAGRDIPFNAGANTQVSADGLSLSASASGVIQFINGKVAISDVVAIPGDVDINVGNINSKASVKISGHIRAGFNVKIDGDLEVNGNVEDCNIDVKGNIFVKGGFFGEGHGIMKAGGDIYLKFAEGQRLISGNTITLGGEMTNCQAFATERIIVKGRRGRIVGGDVKAGKEIRAAELGSSAGTSTSLTVAYDTALMARYAETVKELTRQKDDAGRVKEALYALYRIQMDGKLPPEKQAVLTKLETFLKDLPGSLVELEKQKAALEQAMLQFRDARIAASDVVHPGVRVCFGVVYRDILQDQGACEFSLDGNRILASEYRNRDEKA